MKTMRPRGIHLVLFLAALSISLAVWHGVQRDPIKVVAESPSFESIRKQLSLEVSKMRLNLDDPITLTIPFKNIDRIELPVTRWKMEKGRSRPSFYLAIKADKMSSFGIMPGSESDKESEKYELVSAGKQPAQNYRLVHRLAPGEIDVTKWNGTLRQLMGMSSTVPVPILGEFLIRVSYLDEPNAVNSEWVQLQLVR